MTSPLLPQAFWFRVAVPCPRIDGVPQKGSRGRLLDLPASAALVTLAPLEEKPAWADVRTAWNPGGLAIQVDAKQAGSLGGDQPEPFDDFQVWVDTRDTRDVSRATRFCHRFSVRLRSGTSRTGLEVDFQQRAISRAVADAPLCRPDTLLTRAEATRAGWRLELFLPAEALNGFDPETNRRLGFAYCVAEPDGNNQYLGVGREFPVADNPSLWATLELRD